MEVAETEGSNAGEGRSTAARTAIPIVVLLMVACSAGTRPVDERVADAVLASTVRQRLADDRRFSTTRIDVTVSGGIVTLTGRVPEESLRLRAEDLARGVEGARDVRNLIRVHGSGE